MSRSKRIRENLKITIMHRKLQEVEEVIVDNLTSLRSDTGGVVPLLGPTRCGKSVLLSKLREHVAEAPVRPRVLMADTNFAIGAIPPKPNDGDIYRAILQAIGYSCPNKETTKLLGNRVKAAIRDNGIRVIALDECNHCAERGANFSERGAADQFKWIVDQTGVTLLLVGLPKFQQIIDGNEQLRERSLKTLYFMPYDWHEEADRVEFFSAFIAILRIFEAEGVMIGLDDDDCLRRIYGASGGRVGMMLRIMDAAAVFLAEEPTLGLSHISLAVGRMSQAALASEQFFRHDPPDDAQLIRSYVKILAEAGIGFEPRGGGDLGALFG
jgi:hypothetical protein